MAFSLNAELIPTIGEIHVPKVTKELIVFLPVRSDANVYGGCKIHELPVQLRSIHLIIQQRQYEKRLMHVVPKLFAGWAASIKGGIN